MPHYSTLSVFVACALVYLVGMPTRPFQISMCNCWVVSNQVHKLKWAEAVFNTFLKHNYYTENKNLNQLSIVRQSVTKLENLKKRLFI